MARPQGTALDLKVSRKVNAKGQVVEYFRNQKTGENYGTDRAVAEARIAEWRAALVPSTSLTAGSLDALVADYYRTDEWKALKPRTQETYRTNLEQLRQAAGNMPVKMISIPWVERLKLKLQDQPGKANNTLAVLRIVLGLGVRLGYCTTNPAKEVSKVKLPPRRAVWEPAQIDAFLAAARPSLRLGMALMLFCAQRLSDVLAMTKAHVSEENGSLVISVRQQKTDEPLEIDVHPQLEPILRERLAQADDSMMLVPSPTGLHWRRRNFSRAWDEARKTAAVEGLQRRDLRRTAVVLMAQARMPASLISQITGHSIDTCQRIIDVYLPKRRELGREAMKMWAATPMPTSLSNIVKLGTERQKRRR